jgi:predicted lipid-binding transport protein (Tim44 family)
MDERVETTPEPERVERNTTIVTTGGDRGGGSGLIAIVFLVAIVVLALLRFGGPLKRVYTGGDVNVDIKAPDLTAPSSTPAEPAAAALDKSSTNAMRSLVSADANFDTARFLEGAQAAYRMILEAFWRGERDTLRDLVGDDVRAAFEESIAEREAAGHVLDNRLIAIERAAIENANVENRVASIDVRFDAYIASVARNAAGEVVAGSLTDAIATHDVWTFRRDLRDSDPNWQLVETDEAEA